jgi:hypothetical protein
MKTIKSAVSVVALFVWAFGLLVFAPGFSSTAFANSYSGRWAVLVEGTGTYTRPVNTQSELAQQFFDQGLRLMYGYYTLEAIASLMEALQHDSSNPMIYCGLALASGPNPNSRYGRLPDDPKGNARKAISMAIDFVDSASDKDRALIEAVYIRFDVDGYPEQSTRDRAYLEAMRDLFERYPEGGPRYWHLVRGRIYGHATVELLDLWRQGETWYRGRGQSVRNGHGSASGSSGRKPSLYSFDRGRTRAGTRASRC